MQVRTFRHRWATGIYLVAFAVALAASSLIGNWPTLTTSRTNEVPDVLSFRGPLPLAFVPNRGQAEDNVLFQARGQNAIAFAPQDITFQIQGQTLRLSFVGANPAPDIVADDALPGLVNDIRGNDPAAWHKDLPTYAGLTYRQI